MQQIIFFFIRNKNFLLFMLLFGISIALTLQSRSYHRNKFVHSANFMSGGLYSFKSGITGYFDLKDQNTQLIEENNRLRSLLTQMETMQEESPIDSVNLIPQYTYVSSRVINNSYARTKNWITINKGSKDSIHIDMGVVTSKGIVGIVSNTSSNYASVQSVLNTNTQINAKLNSSGHFGTLTWDTEDPALMRLSDVPRIADVALGDTIVTGGRSTIFPEGILIGSVQNFKLDEGDNYYDIWVKLFNDMTNVKYVYAIENKAAEEIKQLESETEDEE